MTKDTGEDDFTQNAPLSSLCLARAFSDVTRRHGEHAESIKEHRALCGREIQFICIPGPKMHAKGGETRFATMRARPRLPFPLSSSRLRADPVFPRQRKQLEKSALYYPTDGVTKNLFGRASSLSTRSIGLEKLRETSSPTD